MARRQRRGSAQLRSEPQHKARGATPTAIRTNCTACEKVMAARRGKIAAMQRLPGLDVGMPLPDHGIRMRVDPRNRS
jgi:hypothetical protein